jgi:hypothetical protein
VSNPIGGIDVSSWQHPEGNVIDWEEVYAAGYRFAVVKATQGVSYVNPWIARDLSDAGAAGLLLGAYHYFEAGEDPTVQAKWLLNCTQGQPLDLGVFVDWECYSPQKFVHTQELTSFLTEARLTRPQCGVYCSIEWASLLHEENVQTGRLWESGGELGSMSTSFMVQSLAPVTIDGIAAPVDTNVIRNTRGLDIPTSPPERPTAATTHSVKDIVDDESQRVMLESEDHAGSEVDTIHIEGSTQDG